MAVLFRGQFGFALGGAAGAAGAGGAGGATRALLRAKFQVVGREWCQGCARILPLPVTFAGLTMVNTCTSRM